MHLTHPRLTPPQRPATRVQVKLDGRSTDTRDMRILVPILALFVAASLGCSIMDELDNANDKMDEFAGTQAEEEAVEKASPRDIANEWWKTAKSLDKKKLSPSIVSCRIGGSTQFMARDACMNRGGNPGQASG